MGNCRLTIIELEICINIKYDDSDDCDAGEESVNSRCSCVGKRGYANPAGKRQEKRQKKRQESNNEQRTTNNAIPRPHLTTSNSKIPSSVK